jgi:hypothetical protein
LDRMAAAVAGTAGGLFFVMNQDLGHGPGHDEDHHAEAHETHGKNEGQDDDSGDDDSKDKSQGGPKDEAKSKTKNAPAEQRDDSQPEDPSKPGTGKPDKKKADETSTDAPKADEPKEASPDKSDKVGPAVQIPDMLDTDYYCSPMPAASPRAPTKCQASKKAFPTQIRITARRSPSRTRRARRAKVLLRLPSSRALCPPSVLERKIRKSEERLSRTRTHKAVTVSALSNHPVFHSNLAATVHLAALCIVCEPIYLTAKHHCLLNTFQTYITFCLIVITFHLQIRIVCTT